jgi:hypothetical protein
MQPATHKKTFSPFFGGFPSLCRRKEVWQTPFHASSRPETTSPPSCRILPKDDLQQPGNQPEMSRQKFFGSFKNKPFPAAQIEAFRI